MSVSKNSVSRILLVSGKFLIFLSLFLFVLFFRGPILNEFNYLFLSVSGSKRIVVMDEKVLTEKSKKKAIIPVDKEFGVIVPKINANAPVVANVDPFDSKVYNSELTRGVAHAQGSVFPGQLGNVFLFAHSSADFATAQRFNSVFYLLNKMKEGDVFYLTHKGILHKYVVIETKIVNPDQVEYLDKLSNGKTATLMTCWPAGTTLKRLLVIGELNNR